MHRSLALWVTALLMGGDAAAETRLRFVPHADLKVLDPIWQSAYIARNHGYLIYDTLLAMDEHGVVQPQMVDGWEISADGLRYTFTLRDELLFHDGAPVQADDAVASLRRWGKRDAMGVFMMRYVASLEATDASHFVLQLAKPYGLVLESLGKPSSNVPFVMPARVAAIPPTEAVTDRTGSGPFVFDEAAWRPGASATYRRFDRYRPRAEAPSWGAGGKVAHVDVVEWVTVPDPQSAIDALVAGEVDMLEQPSHDLLPQLAADPAVQLIDQNPLGNQYLLRFNSLHPPFDDPRIRQAAIAALAQEDFLAATIGNPAYYKTCAAMFVCGTPLATDAGGEALLHADPATSRRLLAEAGYDGTPVVLLQSTDLPVLTNLAPVARQLLERGGFTVRLESMDWATLVARRARKDKPEAGGWNAFLSSWVAADLLNPITTAALNATCETGYFGWFCDPELEDLKRRFAEAPDQATRRQLAETIQVYALRTLGTHAYLGQWYQPMAVRRGVSGVLPGPAPYFWNIVKAG